MNGNRLSLDGVRILSGAEWSMLIYINVEKNEKIKEKQKSEVENTKFKSKLNGLRIQV